MSFASQTYWQDRFEKNSSPFDWLLPAKTFCDIVKDCIVEDDLRKAELLHIGCGTADSIALQELVSDAEQVHNVDYSQAAIDAGTLREHELKEGKTGNDADRTTSMRWSCVDLLDLASVLNLAEQQVARDQLFDLVLDKSTSDSIACGSDVPISLPYPLSINGWTRNMLRTGSEIANVHPLHILAVNLAAITKPRTGRWIIVSYSDERFPFLPPEPRSVEHGFLPDGVIKAGFTHPNQLWRLERKEKIDLHASESLAERKKRLSTGVVHQPQVSHWLYVLIRTAAVVTD